MIIHELKTIQEEHGYLPAEALQALSRRLNVPLYRLHGVASFYPHFRLQPPPYGLFPARRHRRARYCPDRG